MLGSIRGDRRCELVLINPDEGHREVTVDVKPMLTSNHSDTLVRVLAPWVTGRMAVFVALPSRKFIPVRARAFMEFLIDQTRLPAE